MWQLEKGIIQHKTKEKVTVSKAERDLLSLTLKMAAGVSRLTANSGPRWETASGATKPRVSGETQGWRGERTRSTNMGVKATRFYHISPSDSQESRGSSACRLTTSVLVLPVLSKMHNHEIPNRTTQSLTLFTIFPKLTASYPLPFSYQSLVWSKTQRNIKIPQTKQVI